MGACRLDTEEMTERATRQIKKKKKKKKGTRYFDVISYKPSLVGDESRAGSDKVNKPEPSVPFPWQGWHPVAEAEIAPPLQATSSIRGAPGRHRRAQARAKHALSYFWLLLSIFSHLHMAGKPGINFTRETATFFRRFRVRWTPHTFCF